MAKGNVRQVHGWKAEEGETATKRPAMIFSKKDRNTITMIGETGIDPEILFQRGAVMAVEQELERVSDNDSRALWQERLDELVEIRDGERAARVAKLGVKADRAARRKER